MDITTSFFWQNVLLVVLLTPYVVGIALSAYRTNRSRTSDETKVQRPATESGPPQARPIGRLVAAIGATFLALVFSMTSIVAVAWALVTLVGLPEYFLWGLLVLGVVPVAWVTVWTAGRSWHVEQLLEKGDDADKPIFELGAYLSLPFLPRRSAPPDHAK